ncbi:MAG: hypothetical protein ACKODU_07210, partial [Limnohabitans sp.]
MPPGSAPAAAMYSPDQLCAALCSRLQCPARPGQGCRVLAPPGHPGLHAGQSLRQRLGVGAAGHGHVG